jgi:nucleoside-diphosphate-sugar epimerase
MTSALVIGGTGFVGRHAVAGLFDHGDDVTAMSRGRPVDRFSEPEGLGPVTGDRTDDDALADVARRVDPDLVVDCAAFRPADVRTATEGFADVDAYVYVSSGGVYAVQEIPKREDETPLHDCTPEQAEDDSMATYGPRKAAADRAVAAAADRGVAATSVRPTVVYGPQTTRLHEDVESIDAPSWAEDLPGIMTHHDYWIDRIDRFDRVVVPGDGTAIWHRAYVEDVASGLRIVAERREPGEADNAGDRRVCTLEDVIHSIADALDTAVEVVHASRRELARVGLDPNDFILYHHQMTEYPHVLDTCKLASLGWTSTPVETAAERTVRESVASGRTGSAHDPGRDTEERLIVELTG